MMKNSWKIQNVNEADLIRLAELIALKIRPSDIVALRGDLGSGKTTFARALIRSVLADTEAEVPSPTFALVQTYHATRLNISHVDLYRLSTEQEIDELFLPELLSSGTVILEWPERTKKRLSDNSLDITLSECTDPEKREVTFIPQGNWSYRLERIKQISLFLSTLREVDKANIFYLQGDASSRAYARLVAKKQTYILMDWPPQPDGPPIKNGLSYSKIAHLAESTTNFQSVAELLKNHHMHVPQIFAADHSAGLLLIEDLGDRVFGIEASRGVEMLPMWRSATDTLIEMRKITKECIVQWNRTKGKIAPIQDYDFDSYKIEVQLLPDWYWPFVKGSIIPTKVREDFEHIWQTIIHRLIMDTSRCLTLRDFHSPNLIWLPNAGKKPADKVGILDFQDALIGHPAFDLVSLLQDARLDVPSALEDELCEYYVSKVKEQNPSFEKSDFLFNYSALGAQRNTKILGIFARLWKRDNKSQYLKHIPRIWRYLEKNLRHPELYELKQWYSKHFSDVEREHQTVC